MKRIFSLMLAMLLLLTGCGGTTTVEHTYQQITQKEAKCMMDSYTLVFEFGGIITWPYEVE